MKRADYELLEGLMVSKAAVPPSSHRLPPRCRDEIFLGWSTASEPGRFLILALAAIIGGQLVSGTIQLDGTLLTPPTLLEMVRVFLAQHGLTVKAKNGCREVHLVGLSTVAELGSFQDPLRDLDLRRVGRAHFGITDKVLAADGHWRIELVDLLGYFKASPATLGTFVGPLIDLGGENLEQVFATSPDRVHQALVRRAEIAILAHTNFRAQVLADWGIDVAFHPSLASIAAAIFRNRFFTTPPAPYTTTHEPARRKKKDGSWVDRRRTVHIFNGNRDARISAIRSLHGGRNEAFVAGLINRPVVERDVVSMYPAATLLQPLPTARTNWVKVESLDNIAEMEGTGQFEFRFQDGTAYPCMPVRQPEKDTLLLPLAGQSYATFAEVRLALSMGADIKILSAFGFKPGERERNHDMGRFVRALWDKKKNEKKGGLAYEIVKELLNSALGKLAQRVFPSRTLDIERLARMEGLGGTGALLLAQPDLRGMLRGAPSLGSLWSPESLSLITGRARALIGEIIAKTKPLLVSTDAIITDAGVVADCPAVDALRSVGSDLLVENEADAAVIIRTRLYGLLRHPENVKPGERIFAKNANWAVTKAVRHGSSESKEQFGQTLLLCLEAGENVAPVRQIKKVLTPEDVVKNTLKKGGRIGDEVVVERQTKLVWDRKRRLDDRDCAIFRSSTGTKPYETERRRDAAEHANQVKAGEARRRTRPLSEEKRQRIRDLLRQGAGIREVARVVHAAPSTVSDIRRQMAAEESDAEEAGRG